MGYTTVELIFNAQKPDIIAKFLPKLGDSPEGQELADKILKVSTKMNEKASKRYSRRILGNSRWTPKVNDTVLVKTQPMSDAVKGTKSKFLLLYEGPFLISKIYPYPAYELKDENGRARGKFSKKALNPYREETQHELGTDGGHVRGNELTCRNYIERGDRDRIE